MPVNEDVHYIAGGVNGRGSRTHPKRGCISLHQSEGRIRRATDGEKEELPTCVRCGGNVQLQGKKQDMSYQNALKDASND